MPFTKLDRSLLGSPSGWMPGILLASASNSTRSSSTARCLPSQKCGPPPPNPMCGLGWRPMSNFSGAPKTPSSRLAEA